MIDLENKKRIWLAMLVMMAAARGEAQERQRIVISISERKLTLIECGEVVKTYEIAVGKPSTPSPRGEFTVISRIKNPTWYGPGGQIAPPGKGNPVGTRWIGLSKKGYGIHGTNQPDSIGKAASHGCIRMRNRDVEELFERIMPGTAVELTDL